MRKVLIIALGLAGRAAFVGVQPALADCRTENAACVKGASSPFDTVACGSLFRSCAANHARAAQEQARREAEEAAAAAAEGQSGGGEAEQSAGEAPAAPAAQADPGSGAGEAG